MLISLSSPHIYFILLEVSSSNSVWSYGSLQSTERCSHWADPFCLLIYTHDEPTYTLAAEIKHTTIQFYISRDSYSNLLLPNPTTLLESIICEYVCAMYMLCSMCTWMWVSAYACAHACASRDQHWAPFSNSFPPYFLRRCLSLKLELTVWLVQEFNELQAFTLLCLLNAVRIDVCICGQI